MWRHLAAEPVTAQVRSVGFSGSERMRTALGWRALSPARFRALDRAERLIVLVIGIARHGPCAGRAPGPWGERFARALPAQDPSCWLLAVSGSARVLRRARERRRMELASAAARRNSHPGRNATSVLRGSARSADRFRTPAKRLADPRVDPSVRAERGPRLVHRGGGDRTLPAEPDERITRLRPQGGGIECAPA